MTLPLFGPDDLPEPPSPAQAAQSMPAGKPRLRVPLRDQIEMRWESLDDLLDADHPVADRLGGRLPLDLDAWLGEIKAVEDMSAATPPTPGCWSRCGSLPP